MDAGMPVDLGESGIRERKNENALAAVAFLAPDYVGLPLTVERLCRLLLEGFSSNILSSTYMQRRSREPHPSTKRIVSRMAA